MMKYIYPCLLVISVWLAVPGLVSAKGLPYSAENWSAQDSFILKVQTTEYWETDRPPLGGKGIYSYGSELFREPELFRESRESERESRDRSTDIQSPSADIPPSVHGHTGGVGGSPSGGDPMVHDLSRMDGGGFSSPGNAEGSVPGYNGR